MQIFRKSLSEYVEFAKPFLLTTLIVGVTRLTLSLAGIPNSTAKWFSVSALVWMGAVYFGVRVYTSGFGTYKRLLAVTALEGADLDRGHGDDLLRS